jgi:hypothetical protein
MRGKLQSLVISSTAASGNRSNDDASIMADEEGTFQAQAGSGEPEEKVATA